MSQKHPFVRHTVNVPQSQPLHPGQVKNRAGGYTERIEPKKQLERFLVLGSGGEFGTYYATAQEMTRENAAIIQQLIDEGQGAFVVEKAVEFRNRVPKQDTILFALALIMADPKHDEGKWAVRAHIKDLVWTPTQLFMLIDMIDGLKKERDSSGFGSSEQKMIRKWYADRSPLSLTRLMTKYQRRGGWTHRDVLLKARVKPESPEHNLAMRYAVAKNKNDDEMLAGVIEDLKKSNSEVAEYLLAIEDVWANKENIPRVVVAVMEHDLPWEVLPSELLNSPEIWSMLLPGLKAQALLRNLNRMSAIGLLDHGTFEEQFVLDRLSDQKWIIDQKVHPIEYLQAATIYERGHGRLGSLRWNPNFAVASNLWNAVDLAFDVVKPLDAPDGVSVWVDESGSMQSFGVIGMPEMRAAQAAGLMAMLRWKVEEDVLLGAFSWSGWGRGGYRILNPDKNISVRKAINLFNEGGGTDCAIPLNYLLHHKIKRSVVELHTDNETWAGNVHLAQQIDRYRQEVNPDAKFVVYAYTSTRNSVLRQNVDYALDVVGLDSAAPEVVGSWIRGEWG